jgi:hypothetical protein
LGRSSRERASPSGDVRILFRAREGRKARSERGARKARGAGERNAPRPLTRETSAGAGQEPVPPGFSGRCGGWGLNPVGPARAGRAVSARADRGLVDPAVVLVGCSDCRSRREASDPAHLRKEDAGSSRSRWGWRKDVRSRPAAAKPRVRWRALERGHSSREGVLVSAKQSSLTRRRWRRSLVIISHVVGWGPNPIRLGHGNVLGRVVATEGVRGGAACSARGRKSRRREARQGGARSSSTRTRPCSNRRTYRETGSIDLGVVAKLKLEGRRQAKLHPRFFGDRRKGASLVRWALGDQREAER